MSYTLIISEKPSAARKIAAAITEKGVKVLKAGDVSYLEIERHGEKILVAPAVGHLFGLAQKSKSWTYPVFDTEWQPTFKISKNAGYVKKYYTMLKKLSKDADKFVVATDLDIEGETIAYTILKNICKTTDAKRMEFSTLTKQDLINAYDNAKPHINFGLANAGVTRHTLDFYFGINISRALTIAVKTAGTYKVLSAGRVQGPALAFLAKREKEIQAFISTPFWQIEMDTPKFKAMYENDKILDKKDAEKIVSETTGKDAKVIEQTNKNYKQKPPTPFNLTDLQVEAHKLFSIVPRDTQQIAQKLYEMAVISYPRTSSQILDPKLGFKEILEKLSKNPEYIGKAKQLLSLPKLVPNNGKKTDDAHPPIHPTGEMPKGLIGRDKKIYDLIVKRFFATFGTPATRQSSKIVLDVNTHKFQTEGKRTIENGWFDLYEPYVKLEEVTLPQMTDGEMVTNKKITLLDKETKPPNRYNESSIIKELEKRNLGTKATRAEIINNLYKRNYLMEKRIEVTDLGLTVIDTLEKYCPEIISEDLTRTFEKHMDDIEHEKESSDDIINKAEKELTGILTKYKDHEKEIGLSLVKATRETQNEESTIGPCKVCGVGTLMMKRSKFGRFIACDKYPDCKATYSLPKNGMIKSLKKECEECGFPLISIINKGKKPQQLCINPKCPTKKIEDAGATEEVKEIENGTLVKTCPKCKSKLILRSSIYGKFLGCSGYPKCRYTERLDGKDNVKKKYPVKKKAATKTKKKTVSKGKK